MKHDILLSANWTAIFFDPINQVSRRRSVKPSVTSSQGNHNVSQLDALIGLKTLICGLWACLSGLPKSSTGSKSS